ncbi:MAG TPA: hypothetical protein VL358_13270 [Caulobacteraceae bacterium]|jgi:hypothetical protein|nr:hypothetical protein [Caulobacteraceae bacterium]
MSADLQATAEEELEQALKLSWRQLSSLIPWGDTYVGIAIGGREVEMSRSYLWAEQEGGDILCEVIVYAGESRYDVGGRASSVIVKPET